MILNQVGSVMKHLRMITTKTGVASLAVVFVLLLATLAYGGTLQRTTLHVAQMRCSSCLRVFDAELRKVPGIAGMTARFSERLVVVDHDDKVSSVAIAETISELGYPATVVASREISRDEAHRFQRAGFGGGAGWCNPGGASPVAESWKELRRRLFRRRNGR
ncbi:MAG: heavy metal-associated domain-containing protein [Desulfobulbales bacterium]|nr:heavy metal-associated domain-containing protein [Desulfobulbales bacterium]